MSSIKNWFVLETGLAENLTLGGSLSPILCGY